MISAVNIETKTLRMYPEADEIDSDLKMNMTGAIIQHSGQKDIKYQLVTSRAISEEIKSYCLYHNVEIKVAN